MITLYYYCMLFPREWTGDMLQQLHLDLLFSKWTVNRSVIANSCYSLNREPLNFMLAATSV